MNRIFGASLALGVGLAVVAAEVRGQDRPATPAEQYKAILKESQVAIRRGPEGVRSSRCRRAAVLPDEQADDVRRARVPDPSTSRRRSSWTWPRRYPKDPIALDALTEAVWQVNTTPWPVEMVGRDEARPRAFELLRRDHIRSEKLGPLCERISYGLCAEYEPFLREVLEKNPHKEVRGPGLPGPGPFPEQPVAEARPGPGSTRSWPGNSRTSTARSTSKDCGARTAPRPRRKPRPSSSGPRGTMAT